MRKTRKIKRTESDLYVSLHPFPSCAFPPTAFLVGLSDRVFDFVPGRAIVAPSEGRDSKRLL